MRIKFVLPPFNTVKNKEDARQVAKDWQTYAADSSLSYAELAKCQNYFATLGRIYGLMREFRENGII